MDTSKINQHIVDQFDTLTNEERVQLNAFPIVPKSDFITPVRFNGKPIVLVNFPTGKKVQAIPTADPRHLYIPMMDKEEVLSVDPVGVQRRVIHRLPKMAPHFKKDTCKVKEFAFAIFPEVISGEINGETITVGPGIERLNGTTRSEAEKAGLYNMPDKVMASAIIITDFQHLLEEYYGFDSQEATEVTAEKITGALKVNSIFLNSAKGASGEFSTALKLAYPGNPTDLVITQVNYFRDALIDMDTLGLFKPREKDLAHQSFFCACLIALRKWGEHPTKRNKLLNILRLMATKTDEDISGSKFQGWELLVKYVCNHERYDNWVPQEHFKKTNYKALKPAVSFYLFCIDSSLNNRTYRKNGSKPSVQYFDKANPKDCLYNEMLRSLPKPTEIF